MDSSGAPSGYADNAVSGDRLQSLIAAGQSIWLDFITRDLLTSGALGAMVNEGLTGVTSNPSIFEKAIARSAAYASSIRAYSEHGMSPLQIYERLVIDDIRRACDLLAPTYERTQARDGYVSLEVSPSTAYDADATLSEALRLFAAVFRPNLMIKIPATRAALPAITGAIASGVNVNVTLIFSVGRYREVLNAWLEGLEAALRDGARDLSRIASVASFFISRVDEAVDPILQALGEPHRSLRGRVAVANAATAYRCFSEMYEGARFRDLARYGAQAQRPLWASTGQKSAAYSDVFYVETLVAPHTVNTLPPQTLAAFKHHGQVRSDLASAATQAEAEKVLNEVRAAGIELVSIAEKLEHDGVRQFANAFEALLGGIVRQTPTGSSQSS